MVNIKGDIHDHLFREIDNKLFDFIRNKINRNVRGYLYKNLFNNPRSRFSTDFKSNLKSELKLLK